MGIEKIADGIEQAKLGYMEAVCGAAERAKAENKGRQRRPQQIGKLGPGRESSEWWRLTRPSAPRWRGR